MATTVKGTDRFNSGIAKCICDDNSHIIYANQAFYDMTGYSEEEFRYMLKNELLAIIPDDDARIFWQNTALEQEGAAVFRLFHRNGELHTTLAKSAKTMQADEKNYTSFSFYNITEAADLERQDADSRLRLQSILENKLGGIALLELTDIDTLTLRYLSRGFYATDSANRENYDQKPDIHRFIRAEDLPSLIAALLNCGTQQQIADCIFRTPVAGDNEWRHLRAVKIDFHDSNFPVFLAFVMDISVVKQSELSAAAQNLQLSSLLNAIPAALMIWQATAATLDISFATAGLYRLIGCTAAEYAAIFRQDFTPLIVAEDRAAVHTELAAAFAQGRQAGCSFRFMRHNSDSQQLRWALLRGFVIDTAPDAPIFLVLLQDITAQKNLEEELLTKERQLNLTLAQTRLLLFQVNHLRHRCTAWRTASTAAAPDYAFTDLPEEPIAANLIAPEDQENFRRFYTLHLSKATDGQIILRLGKGDGGFLPYRVSFRNTFDAAGHPLLATGVCQPLSRQIRNYQLLQQEELLQQTLAPELLATATADLEDNHLLQHHRQDLDQPRYATVHTYNDLITTGATFAADPESKKLLLNRLNRDALRQSFARGEEQIICEFRRFDPQGKIRWVCCEGNLIEDPATDHLRIFLYLRDIHRCKQIELQLEPPAERLLHTGLYTPDTTLALIDSILQTPANPDGTGALLLIEIGDFAPLYKHGASKTIDHLAKLLRLHWDGQAILGQDGQNQLLLFIQELPQDQLQQLIQELFAMLQCPAAAYANQPPPAYRIGAASCFYREKLNARELLAHSRQALTAAAKEQTAAAWAIYAITPLSPPRPEA
ncbi:MAG: PAS domain-containing protein [Clostridiales bacterium]